MEPTLNIDQEVLRQATDWWHGLESQWQRAFSKGVLQLGDTTDLPKPEDLHYLYQEAFQVRLAGPSAPHPNIDFELTNLSGLIGLKSLTYISITNMAVDNLRELRDHTSFTSLFVQDNQLTSLAGIEGNADLLSLHCQGNLITDLNPIRSLTKLQTLYAPNNRLSSLEGITPEHAEEMRNCTVLPNEDLRDRHVLRLQNECGIIARTG